MKDAEPKTVLAAMRACPFFAGIDDETLLLIRPTAKRVLQPRQTVVFHAGEPCRGFYIVESGAIKIYKEGPDGREHVLHVATRGDCFGEAALFLGIGYPASAAAILDSELILLRRDGFLELLRRNPDISFTLLGSMAVWLHRLVTSIESLTLKDAGARLAQYLISELKPETAAVHLKVPKQVLASHLGITGETLSRLLARFEAENIIAARGRTINVLDRERLSEAAEIGKTV